MKKALIVFALLIAVAVPSFAAVNDMMFNVGLTTSESTFDLFKNGQWDPSFTIGADADFAMIFDHGVGFDVAIRTERNFSDLTIGAYFAYMIDVNSTDLDIMLSIGPTFEIASNSFNIGVDAMCDLLIDITNSIYVDLGIGVQMDIVEFRDSGTESSFNMSMPLPSVGIGFKF